MKAQGRWLTGLEKQREVDIGGHVDSALLSQSGLK